MIEVGEYIRTKDGRIGKIEAIFKRDKYSYVFHTDINCDDYECKHYVYDFDIKNHSKNIIDLIEVGDIVNGYKVVETYKDNELKGWKVGEKKEEIWLGVVVSSKMIKEPLQEYFDNNMIKTILTHEMYEQNCYKIGE